MCVNGDVVRHSSLDGIVVEWMIGLKASDALGQQPVLSRKHASFLALEIHKRIAGPPTNTKFSYTATDDLHQSSSSASNPEGMTTPETILRTYYQLLPVQQVGIRYAKDTFDRDLTSSCTKDTLNKLNQ
jgi:hypothetical protein